MIASVTLSRPGPTLPPPAWLPDLTLVAGGAAARPGHRLVLARLSSYTRSLLQASLEQEEACLVIPDLSPRVLDCILGLAYQGKVGGLGSGEIGLVREACRLLHIKEEEFVVRLQERRQEEVELVAHTVPNIWPSLVTPRLSMLLYPRRRRVGSAPCSFGVFCNIIYTLLFTKSIYITQLIPCSVHKLAHQM